MCILPGSSARGPLVDNIQLLQGQVDHIAVELRPEPKARAVHAIFRDLMNTKDGATYFAGRVWGVSAHYELAGGNLLVGYSVPNFELGDGRTINDFMHDGSAC